MKSRQSGFTLIELVMVIVILGILAATAIPKFVNLQDDARQAAVDGVAGALSSASAINYASYLASPSGPRTSITGATNCSALGAIMQGGLPGTVSLPASPPTGTFATAGDVGDCVVSDATDGTKQATARVIFTP